MGSRALGDVNYRWTPGDLSNRIGRTIEAAQVHQRSPHAALPYELRPEVDRIWLGVGLRTNSAGMRDDEVSLEKPSGVRRIVVLGDSFAFGWKVPVEQTFSEQLEGRLNRKAGDGGPRFEVLNMGVVGYAMRDPAVVLRDKAMAWSPDVVVIAYVLNDPETDRVWLHNVFQEPEWWQYSSFLRRAALTVRNREIERVGDGSYYRYLHRDPAKWSSVS